MASICAHPGGANTVCRSIATQHPGDLVPHCFAQRYCQLAGRPLQRPFGQQPSTEASFQSCAIRVGLGPVCAISVGHVNPVGLSGSVGFSPHTMEAGHIPSQESQSVSLEIGAHALDRSGTAAPASNGYSESECPESLANRHRATPFQSTLRPREGPFAEYLIAKTRCIARIARADKRTYLVPLVNEKVAAHRPTSLSCCEKPKPPSHGADQIAGFGNERRDSRVDSRGPFSTHHHEPSLSAPTYRRSAAARKRRPLQRDVGRRTP